MKQFKNWRLMVLVSALSLGLFALSCGGDEEQEEGPPLPPEGSMRIELALFEGGENLATDEGKADGVGPKANFNNAAIRVWWLNTAIALNLAVPVVTFAAALSDNPSYADGEWLWDFSTKTNDGKEVSAVLRGWFDGGLKEGIFLNLEMKVTCETCKVPTEDYIWYTGRFNTAGTDGHWQFFNPEIAQEDQTFIKIEYDVTDDTHKSLIFTNLRTDGHEDAGDIIEYSVDGDTAHVSVHDEDKALDYTTEWSLSDGTGWLIVPDFNEGEKACWDGAQQNAECK